MKRVLYVLLLTLLLPVYAFTQQMAVKDSLGLLLRVTKDTDKRFAILTNLVDISRDDSQIRYAKMLLKEAKTEKNNYYTEIALTEIMRHYTNHDRSDSLAVYMEQTRSLIPNSRYKTALLNYFKMMNDVRIVFYTHGDEQKKLLEKRLYELKMGSDLNIYDRIADNFILGMAKIRIPGLPEGSNNFDRALAYFQHAAKAGRDLPKREAFLYLPNILNMLTKLTTDTVPLYKEYSLAYYNFIEEWMNSPEMRDRPYFSKRHLLNAVAGMAQSAQVLGKDVATSFFKEFTILNKRYPQDAAVTPEYEYWYTAIGYYNSIDEYAKVVSLCDSMIEWHKAEPDLKNDVVLFVKQKADALEHLGKYKEALTTYKQFSALEDSAIVREMEDKSNVLEIRENVNKLEKQNREIHVRETRQRNWNYVLLFCAIVGVVAILMLINRLVRQKAVARVIKESNRKLLEANIKVRQSDELKRSFVQNMSHEVRTPLNAINGFSELIVGEDVTQEERMEYAKIILENCAQITQVLDGLLEAAQFEGENHNIVLSSIHLHEVCDKAMDAIKEENAKPTIRYELKGDSNDDVIFSNHNYLRIVVHHLLSNSNKFTESGSITVSYQLDHSSNTATIRVEDTGCGIASNKREWIFIQFTKESSFVKGTGLGLYICRQIVERLNGHIKVDPGYEGGAGIVIHLPISQEQKEIPTQGDQVKS